jgi:hypothetical protein
MAPKYEADRQCHLAVTAVTRHGRPQLALSPDLSTEMAPLLMLPETSSVKLLQRLFMMTTPANAIREEVWELIDDQIEAFGRPSRPNVLRTQRVSLSRRENEPAWSRTRPDRQNNYSGKTVPDCGIVSLETDEWVRATL